MKSIKVAIIGSGAVTCKGYLPASESVSNLQVTCVIDHNIDRARDTASQFSVASYAGDYHKVVDRVDAVVIATPPASHAAIAKDCLGHGLHVMCEKPLTRSAEDAREIVETARSRQLHLAVSANRRFSASSQMLKSMMETGFLGKPYKFEAVEGHFFRWPMQSGYRFSKGLSGGGVLAEFGPHVFDLLLWWLGDDLEVTRYRDDNLGGVEANALVELVWRCSSSEEIYGFAELSNTRNLSNMIRIYGEGGLVEVPARGGESFTFYVGSLQQPAIEIRPSNLGDYPRNWIEQIAFQLSAFAESILTNKVCYVPASDAIRVMEIIEKCYATREVMLQPWEAKWLTLDSRR